MSKDIRKITMDDMGSLKIPSHPCMPNLAGNQDETWAVIKNNALEAVCSLWIDGVPTFKECRTGVFGHFFSKDAFSGQAILLFALERLKKHDCTYAIGPMNGNTWHSYRIVIATEENQPFFMEYYTPKGWPEIFVSAGFEEIATYSSARTMNINYIDPSAEKFAVKKEALGLIIRPFNLEKAQAELTALHTLSLVSFSKNFLYTDITLSDFLELYEKIVPYIDPNYFLLAEHEGKLVGFIFAIPDLLQKQRGDIIDALIIKTVAKIPERAYAGLGNYLVHIIHQRAVVEGYKSVVHALIYDSNVSRVISNKSAKTIRKYALYGKRLDI